MKDKIKIVFSTAGLLLLAVVGAVSVVPPAYAACENGEDGVAIGEANKGDCAKTTAFSFNGKTTDVGISDVVIELLKFASAAVGIAVVGGIIWGGIVYATSKGSPANVQKGIKIIGSSVVALILYLLMYAIIQFLVPNSPLK